MATYNATKQRRYLANLSGLAKITRDIKQKFRNQKSQAKKRRQQRKDWPSLTEAQKKKIFDDLTNDYDAKMDAAVKKAKEEFKEEEEEEEEEEEVKEEKEEKKKQVISRKRAAKAISQKTYEDDDKDDEDDDDEDEVKPPPRKQRRKIIIHEKKTQEDDDDDENRTSDDDKYYAGKWNVPVKKSKTGDQYFDLLRAHQAWKVRYNIASAEIEALESIGKPVPESLRVVLEEEDPLDQLSTDDDSGSEGSAEVSQAEVSGEDSDDDDNDDDE
jgi:hypothetical protein